MKPTLIRLTLFAIPIATVSLSAIARERPVTTSQPAAAAYAAPTDPKAAVASGLEWLTRHQMDNGGFGQGEEAAGMRGSGAEQGQANVADTSMAGLAFIRAGSSPKAGPHQRNVQRAVEFVLGEVEASDEASI